jgi:hypothetical protein
MNAERKRNDCRSERTPCAENIAEYFTGCGAKTMERRRVW